MENADRLRRTAADRRHSPSRERVLREIERHRSASVSELSVWTGLHENTVRGHVRRLHEDGHVKPARTTPDGRGRPTQRWHAVTAEAIAPYAGLAVSLAEALTRIGPGAAATARATGRDWGVRLVEDRDDDRGARDLVLEVMREQGFAPQPYRPRPPGPADDSDALVLTRCPLLAAAHRTRVVCAVHEGMIEGIARTRDPESDAGLEPFAADGACLLHLRRAS